MSNFVRVMDGLKSNAGGFEYKLAEVNVANNWNPTAEKGRDFEDLIIVVKIVL